MVKKWLSIAGILVVIGGVGAVIALRNTAAGETEAIERSVDESFSKVNIKSNNAKLEVKPTEEETASIELADVNPNEYQLKHEVKNGQLQIEVKQKGFKLINFNTKTMKLTVHLPKQSYDALTVRGENGAIGIDQLDIKHIDVKSDNGAATLSQLTADDIHVKSDNGKIQLTEIEADRVSTLSDNGLHVLEQVNDAELKSKADNGKIILKTSNINRPIHLETDNGAIEIETDEKPNNVTFDIKMDNGKAKIFGSSDWDTIVGKGENLVKLVTDNGNITVK